MFLLAPVLSTSSTKDPDGDKMEHLMSFPGSLSFDRHGSLSSANSSNSPALKPSIQSAYVNVPVCTKGF